MNNMIELNLDEQLEINGGIPKVNKILIGVAAALVTISMGGCYVGYKEAESGDK